MTLVEESDLEPPSAPRRGDPYKEYVRGVEETERREVALQLQEDALPFDAAYDDASPTLPEGQRFAVVTMGTQVLAPRPVSRDESSFRLYGVFPDQAEAREHALKVKQLEPRYSVVVVPCGEWIMMPQEEEYLHDADAARKAIDRHVRRDAENRTSEKREMMRAISQKSFVHAPAKPAKQHDPDAEETTDAERAVYGTAGRCPAGADVFRQHLFIANIIKDPTGAGEAVFRVLGCFHTDDDVHRFTSAHYRHREHSVYVFPTCEWICPNGEEERGENRRKYEQPELEKIMNAALDNEKNVVTYKEWKAKKEAQNPGCFDEPEGVRLIEDDEEASS